MAKGAITQEIFDAIMQEMVGTYEVSEEDFAKLVPGPSSAPADRDEKRSRSPLKNPARYSKNWDRRRSRSWSSDSSGCEDFHLPGRRRKSGKHGKKGPKKPSPQQLANAVIPGNFIKRILANKDSVLKLGIDLIRWAGFHTLKGNEVIGSRRLQNDIHSDTCSKLVASFKCPIQPEHKSHCFVHIGNFKHPALKKPRLDDTFYQLMVDKGVVAEKLGFSKVINPLDNTLGTLQLTLLKCAKPMFLACNEYEVKPKSRRESRAKLLKALEKTVSLCRKSLVLIGLSYSLISSFRQDNILEAVGLRELAPKPSDFPNLEDSLLFGKEYMTELKNWLDRSEHPVEITYGLLTQEEKRKQAQQAKLAKEKGPRLADPVALSMIDYLLEYTIKNCRLKGTQKGKPQFWFMFDESTYEYKYYRLKLLEMQKLKQSTVDTEVQANAYHKSPEDLANESVRAMILAKKMAEAKKKCHKGLYKTKRIQRSTIGTQTDPITTSIQELQPLPKQTPSTTDLAFRHGLTLQQSCESAASMRSSSSSLSQNNIKNLKASPAKTSVESKSSSNLPLSDVDTSTRGTAENLARFLVEMGPELAGFNLDGISVNPEFWFLNEKQSPAFQYFSLKLTEFRQAKGLTYDPFKSDNVKEAAPQCSESKGSECRDPKPQIVEREVTIVCDSDSDCEIIEPQQPAPRCTESQRPKPQATESIDSVPLVSYCSEDENSDGEDPSQETAEQSCLFQITVPQDCTSGNTLHKVLTPPPQIKQHHQILYLKSQTPLPQGPMPQPPLIPLPPQPPNVQPLPPLPKEPEPQPPCLQMSRTQLKSNAAHSGQLYQPPLPKDCNLEPSLPHQNTDHSALLDTEANNVGSRVLLQDGKISEVQQGDHQDSVHQDCGTVVVVSQDKKLSISELVTEQESTQPAESVRKSAVTSVSMDAMQSLTHSPQPRKRGRPPKGATVSPKRVCYEDDDIVEVPLQSENESSNEHQGLQKDLSHQGFIG
ncbi:SURP and G-patch domain-containing protein 2-like [Ambystoma mexicanum]|uniref:SURP and G-patch domain-containing protein 2-like n=1 Tax=Ambystoma mexicanum TaxID=8296 RepID=UPI0037E83AFB